MRFLGTIIALVLGIVMLVQGVSLMEARDDAPTRNYWLVSARSADVIQNGNQNVDIVRMLPGSDTMHTLVNDIGMVFRISFSPNGRHLVYDTTDPNPSTAAAFGGGVSTRYNHQVYVRPVGQGEPRLLAPDISETYAPAWSPDGEWIAFVGRTREQITDPFGMQQTTDVYAIYVARPDGSDRQRLTETIRNGRLQWSPDSQLIIFPADEANNNIFTIRRDGSDLRQLTYNPGSDLSPVYSPDGSMIVFLSDRNNMPWQHDVWMMTADGTLPDVLYNSIEFSGAPAWSPDGRYVVSVDDAFFAAGRGRRIYALRQIEIETGDSYVLTDLDSSHWAPTYTPPISFGFQAAVPLLAGTGFLFIALAGLLRHKFVKPHNSQIRRFIYNKN